MGKKAVAFLVAFVVTLLLDQATKFWVWTQLQPRVDEIRLVPGFLSIVHAQNPGAAFGIMADSPYKTWIFLGFTVFAVAVIVDLFRRLAQREVFLASTLGLLGAGAIGNAIDRVHKGTVTDFIMVYTRDPTLAGWLDRIGIPNPWPSFNIADSALVVGVILFLLHTLFLQDRAGDEELEALAEEELRGGPVAGGAESEDGSIVGPNEDPEEGRTRH